MVIPPGYEGTLVDIGARAAAALTSCAWPAPDIFVEGGHARLVYGSKSGAVVVTLLPAELCQEPVRGATASFCITAEGATANDAGPCGLSAIVAAHREAIRASTLPFAWVEAHPGSALATEQEPNEEESARVSGSWERTFYSILLPLLLLAALASAWRARAWRALTATERVALLACVALAVALRCFVQPFPSDIRTTLDMASGDDNAHQWAAAYAGLMQLVFAIGQARLETLTAANAILSVATVIVLYALVRIYFDSHLAATATAAVLAAHPVLVRFAVSDSAHLLVGFAFVMAALLLSVWLRGGGHHWLVQAAGWLAVCGNARNDAIVFGASFVLLALGLWQRRSQRDVLVFMAGATGAALLMLPALLRVLGTIMGDGGQANVFAILNNPFLRGPHSPFPFVLAGVAGSVLMLVDRRRRRRAAFFLAALWCSGLASMEVPLAGNQDTNFRYFLPLISLFAALAGCGLALPLEALVEWAKDRLASRPCAHWPYAWADRSHTRPSCWSRCCRFCHTAPSCTAPGRTSSSTRSCDSTSRRSRMDVGDRDHPEVRARRRTGDLSGHVGRGGADASLGNERGVATGRARGLQHLLSSGLLRRALEAAR